MMMFACNKSAAMRVEAVSIAQDRFADKGVKIKVQAVGEDNTVMVATSTVFTDAIVIRIKRVYLDDLKDLGFKRAYLYNPENSKTWILDLTKENK